MGKSYNIKIDGQEFWCGDDELILDKAEDMGLELPYSCRAGSCSSCAAEILSGEVDQSEGSFLDEDQKRQFALLCVSYPKSNCTFLSHAEDKLKDIFHYNFPWGNVEMCHHYFYGNGRRVTLSEMGLLDTVREIVKREDALDNAGSIWGRFIAEIAKGKKSFINSYSWGGEPDLPWAMGSGVLSGEFIGVRAVKKDICHIQGVIHFRYSDIFEDPIDIGELMMRLTKQGEKIAVELPHGVPYRYDGIWSERVNVSIPLF